ncbi:hypothetical protein VTI28DRAFT_6600 [Corynascus sepedonium]
MKKPLLLLLSNLFTAVWAGGYQGCLERVALYKAYEIDWYSSNSDKAGLVDVRMGFRCNEFDETESKCKGGWTPCHGSLDNGGCTYDEFMDFIEPVKVPRSEGESWGVIDSETKRLKIKETAIKCYELYGAAPDPSGSGKTRKVSNYKAYNVMKGASPDFNDLLIKMGDLVNDLYVRKGTWIPKDLFDDFDEAWRQLTVARTGDHGPYLIKEAKKQLGETMTIVTENLGANPVGGGDWETVDWAATVKKARENGIEDAGKLVKDMLQELYHGDQTSFKYRSARSHRQVMKSAKMVTAKSRRCRG